MGRDAAPCRACECIRDCTARDISFENIGFEMNLPLRAVNRRLEGWKIFAPRAQQTYAITGNEFAHARFNVEVNAAWSEMRAHG